MDEQFLIEVFLRPWYPNLDPKYKSNPAIKDFPGNLYLHDLNSKIVNGIRIRQVRVKKGKHQIYIYFAMKCFFLICLLVCLFVCLFVCLSTCLFVCLSTSLFVFPISSMKQNFTVLFITLTIT